MTTKNSFSYKLITYSGLGFLLLLALVAFKPFAIIKAGDRRVIMNFGKVQDMILDEGL